MADARVGLRLRYCPRIIVRTLSTNPDRRRGIYRIYNAKRPRHKLDALFSNDWKQAGLVAAGFSRPWKEFFQHLEPTPPEEHRLLRLAREKLDAANVLPGQGMVESALDLIANALLASFHLR